MRKLLLGGLIAFMLAVIAAPLIYSQSVQCGGSFTPDRNCRITGLWDFRPTNTSRTTYPVPFQQYGTDVTGVLSAVRDLTNTEVIGLSSTPITIIAAPGAGKFIDVVGISAAFNYTSVYAAGSDLKCFWGSRVAGNACSPAITVSGFLTNAADIITRVSGVPDNTKPPITNLPVVIQATTNTAFTGGNASNSLRVVIEYRIVATGL